MTDGVELEIKMSHASMLGYELSRFRLVCNAAQWVGRASLVSIAVINKLVIVRLIMYLSRWTWSLCGNATQ